MSDATLPARVTGIVYLVGAGPGDPGLITVRGLQCLRRADAVLYDRLASVSLLDEAPAQAQRIDVGKGAGRQGMEQQEINQLMIELAQQGLTVVRLKGGDPYLFGRGGEEAMALRAAGVPCQVVAGVTSAIAVPAAAGIPVTYQHLSHSLAVITGHTRLPLRRQLEEDDGGEPGLALDDFDWKALAAMDTLVCLMGVATLPTIVERLLAAGRAPETPVAIIEQGTLPEQRLITGSLANIVSLAAQAAVRAPAVIVVGNVVALHQALDPAATDPHANSRAED